VEAIEKVGLFMPDRAILGPRHADHEWRPSSARNIQSQSQLPLLLISVQEVSRQLAEAARGAGFRGAVSKSRAHEIVEAVEALVNNELFFGPEQPTSIV